MKRQCVAVRATIRTASKIWANLSRRPLLSLVAIADKYNFSISGGDLIYLNNGWYVTHTGLLGLARRKRCAGIHVRPISESCDASSQRWAFEATVHKSRCCRCFSGYGDADPSNVSPLVRGAEMRVAETRVNRPLRKAYGIGICSVEEIGSFAGQSGSAMNHPVPYRPFCCAFSLALAQRARAARRADSVRCSAVSLRFVLAAPLRPILRMYSLTAFSMVTPLLLPPKT